MGVIRAFIAMTVLAVYLPTAPASPAVLKTLAYHNADMRLNLAYREGTSWVGDQKNAVIVTAAVLTVRSSAASRTYDLSALNVRPGNWYVVRPPAKDCGSKGALARSGPYAIFEVVQFGKGCRPWPTFIDTRTGRVAWPATLDLAAAHTGDIEPPAFRSYARLLVVGVDTVSVPRSGYSDDNRDGLREEHTIVHVGTGAAARDFVVNGRGAEKIRVGQSLQYGTLKGYDAVTNDDVVLRLMPADEGAYERRQSPEPDPMLRAKARNDWFLASEAYGKRGDFLKALDALEKTVDLDEDPQLKRGDAASLAHCREMVANVASGKASSAVLAAHWYMGCRVN